MKLKVGMYVRTKDGKIFDCYVSEQMGKPIYYPKSSKTNGYIDYEEVYKKSKCIIDLIEVGDYVNGLRINSITEVDENHDVRFVWNLTTYGDNDISFSNEEIKSIVTKEMFNSVKYEVE